MLATAVLTSQQDRIFLIDEPHAFLHPDAEKSLIKFINAHARHQYVAATHSGVFLNAYPLRQTRLLTIDNEGTRINDVSNSVEVLEAVGITASDLWSSRHLVWVEGPSEKLVLDYLIETDEALSDLSLRVAAMPDAARSAARSARTAQATVEFCGAITAAVLPLRVNSMFIFDSDEKSRELRDRVEEVTGGSARFLEVRELENLYLSPGAIQAVIAEKCHDLELQAPTEAEVQARLNELVQQTGDPALYRLQPDEPSAAKVAGSEVLPRLYWEWTQSEYDKVVDGLKIAKALHEREAAALEPLLALVREFVS
jgi:hypothetical protein